MFVFVLNIMAPGSVAKFFKKVWNGAKNIVGGLFGGGDDGEDEQALYQQQLEAAQKQQQEYELAQARQAQQQIQQQKIQRINNPDFLPAKQGISQI